MTIISVVVLMAAKPITASHRRLSKLSPKRFKKLSELVETMAVRMTAGTTLIPQKQFSIKTIGLFAVSDQTQRICTTVPIVALYREHQKLRSYPSIIINALI
jgi:hypothetical protein